MIKNKIDNSIQFQEKDLFDSDTIYIPTKKEIEKSYMLGVYFFLKDYIGLNWEQMYNFLEFLIKNKKDC